MKIVKIEWKTTGSGYQLESTVHCPICDHRWYFNSIEDSYVQDCRHKIFTWYEKYGLKLGGFTKDEKAERLAAWDKSTLDDILKDMKSHLLHLGFEKNLNQS